MIQSLQVGGLQTGNLCSWLGCSQRALEKAEVCAWHAWSTLALLSVRLRVPNEAPSMECFPFTQDFYFPCHLAIFLRKISKQLDHQYLQEYVRDAVSTFWEVQFLRRVPCSSQQLNAMGFVLLRVKKNLFVCFRLCS